MVRGVRNTICLFGSTAAFMNGAVCGCSKVPTASAKLRQMYTLIDVANAQQAAAGCLNTISQPWSCTLRVLQLVLLLW
jgi:hypothetical protein